MSDFTFGCPEYGQKISCDASYGGTQITCPTCRQPLTVPAPAPAAGPVTPPAVVPLGATAAPAQGAAPLPARSADPTGPPPPPGAPAGPAEKSRPGPKPSLWELASAPPAAEAGTAEAGPPATGYSILAMASLFCAAWVVLGFIPGILCGHLARAKMRSNPLLKGKEIATAGLAISYAMLGLVLAIFGPFLLMHQLYKPVMVERTTPAQLKALQPRIVDEVKLGPAAAGGNETEHNLLTRGFSRSGSFAHNYWRESYSGGAFSYAMKVLPDAAMSVNCRYYGTEQTLRIFDIIVEDQIIGTQQLCMNNPGHYFDVEYKIPPGVTKGKSKVRVELMAHGGMTAGRMFAIEMLRR